MKKILIRLLILFTLFNNSNCMEEKEEHFEPFQSLPRELRYKVIITILEENITSWDEIFKLDRKSLKEILNNITLISKDFLVLEKEELKNFIRKLKQNRFTCLKKSIKDFYKDVSQEELNKKLTDLLESDMSQNDLEESVRLIIAGADIDVKNHNDQTALMRATLFGHLEIVKLLINEGADINIRDRYNKTALKMAALRGHTEIVRLLINADAHVNTQNNTGWTALIYAARFGHTEIVSLLSKND